MLDILQDCKWIYVHKVLLKLNIFKLNDIELEKYRLVIVMNKFGQYHGCVEYSVNILLQ